jgi:hypothetical protein
MAAVLPTIPIGSQTSVTLKSSSVDQTPYLGGPVQRIMRLGDRWIYEVQCRPMQARQAGTFVGALLQGLSAKVLCPLKISGFDLSGYSDGTATSGAGKSLVHAGGGAVKFVGQYFSLVKDGVRYLHMITSVSGQTLGFIPALKVPIAGGEVIEFGSPKIEGFLDGGEQSWTIGLVQNLGLSFRIVEAQ